MARKEEKDLRGVLSNLGLAFEIMRVLIHAILKKGGTVDDLRRLLNESDLVDKVAGVLVVIKPLTALVKYFQPTYAQLCSAFDWVSDHYEKAEFGTIECCKGVVRQNGEMKFEYVHLNRYASTDEVLAVMDRQDLRPALYEEGLGFAECNPNEQCKFSIVILGSICAGFRGRSSVAFLDSCEGKRHLDLWVEGGWPANFRFLAVRK